MSLTTSYLKELKNRVQVIQQGQYMKQMEDLKAKLGPESLLVPESSTFAGSIKTAATGSFETKAAQKKIIHEWEKATKEVFENCSRNLRLQRRCR